MQPFSTHDAASRARQAAQAAVNSLNNPYGYSSHYAQAYYSQQQQQQFAGNIGSSTLHANPASTFTAPGVTFGTSSQSLSLPSKPANSSSARRIQPQQTHWYEPGPHRCSYEACMFQGSKKSVEIHMMDRHLIYPSDWHKRKRRPEWDADPSLNNG